MKTKIFGINFLTIFWCLLAEFGQSAETVVEAKAAVECQPATREFLEAREEERQREFDRKYGHMYPDQQRAWTRNVFKPWLAANPQWSSEETVGAWGNLQVLVGRMVTDADLEGLKNLSGLLILKLVECDGITDKGLAAIGRVRSLIWLEFNQCSLRGSPTSNWAGLLELQHLVFDRNSPMTGLGALPAFPSLIRLDLGPGLTNAHLPPFENMPLLKTLTLSGPLVNDAAFTQIANAKSLQFLTIEFPRQRPANRIRFTHDGFARLAALTQLKSLKLFGCDSLFVESTRFNRLIAAVSHLSSLKYLGLYPRAGLEPAEEERRKKIVQLKLPECEVQL